MKFLIIVTLLGAAVCTAGAVACSRASAAEQPIAFNHLKHKEADVSCDVCHARFQESEVSGRPLLETCMICHEEAQTKSPEEEKIRRFAAEGKEIPWERVYFLPDHVYFSHRRHAVMAKIECSECHADIGERTTPPDRPAVKHTMERCIACHEKSAASTACNDCHR